MAFAVIATILSLAWMCYRVSILLKIPIPTLVKLLGLDLPAPPRVSLHGIASDSVTLHWSLPEKAGSVAKHIIQINGINVGESERRGETSVTVTGLNPDQLYNLRVIAANNHNFQAQGQLIRLRTRRKSHDGTEGSSQVKGEHPDDQPSVQSHASSLEQSHSTPQQQPQPHQHHRDGHHHSHHGKRGGRDRRQQQPPIPESTYMTPSADEQRTVESLTAELEAVRNEIEEIDQQTAHAEEEHKAQEAVLIGELEQLREKKKCEDAGRHQLRTETRTLEEAKRTAEAQKTKIERALKAKQDEITKMQHDSMKWEKERLAALEKAERLSKEAEESKQNARNTEKELHIEIKEAQTKINELEDEIRTIVASIKAMEQERESSRVALADGSGIGQNEDEKLEKEWQERQRNLETRYVVLFNAFRLAEDDYIRSRDAVSFWKSRRGSTPNSSESPPVKKTKQRRTRNRKSRTQTISNPISPFTHDSRFNDLSVFYNPNTSQPLGFGPVFPSGNNFFSYHHGNDTNSSGGFDKMNGLGISPTTADALLPSNLFSTDDPPSPPSRLSDEKRSSFLPQSPMSSGSQSTSHLSSPQSSVQHINLFHPAADGIDGTTVGAANPALNGLRGVSQPVNEPVSGTRRLVNLFSFNRQRGKTLPLDPPLLGSLKPAESRSLPRSHDGHPVLDPIGTRRRSGSAGWHISSNLNFLNSKTKIAHDNLEESLEQTKLTFDDSEPENLFDRSEPVSPRPLSTASYDGQLPRPSSGASAAFGWPANPVPQKSVLSANWSDFEARRFIKSANASSASIALHQPIAPPGFSIPTVPAKLNPAAPNFQASTAIHNLFHNSKADSVSINTDNASVATSESASGSVIETVQTKESLFSRLNISRKGSTSKFNISWKKEGGLFSKKDKKEHNIASSPDAGDDTDGLPEFIVPSLASSPNPSYGVSSPWKKWGRNREHPTSEAEDNGEGGVAGDSLVTPVAPPAQSSSWSKKEGGGFFSRKKDHDNAEGGKWRNSADLSGNPAIKKESLFFGKKADKEKEKEKKEKDRDKDKDKKELNTEIMGLDIASVEEGKVHA